MAAIQYLCYPSLSYCHKPIGIPVFIHINVGQISTGPMDLCLSARLSCCIHRDISVHLYENILVITYMEMVFAHNKFQILHIHVSTKQACIRTVI